MLHYVKRPGDVLVSLAKFNLEAREHPEVAKRLMGETRYWVYCPSKGVFGPGKFVGFQDMNFPKYKAALKGEYVGHRFYAHNAMVAIQRALAQSFSSDVSMWPVLSRWAEGLLGAGVVQGADSRKWRFVHVGPRASLSGDGAGAPQAGAESQYWFTMQYPKVAHAGSGAAVWVSPKYQEGAKLMREGDYVAIYETGLNRQTGEVGEKAVVVLSRVQKVLAHPQLGKDPDGKEWLKIAMLKPIAEEGRCPHRDTVAILKPHLEMKPGGNLGQFLLRYGGKATPISREQFEGFGEHFKDFAITDAEVGKKAAEAEKKAAEALEEAEDEGQGYVSSHEIRRAVESHAASMAKLYLKKQGFKRIVDCSKTESFDFACVRNDKEYCVEVKGTQTTGATVILTAKEVAHMKSVGDRAILFVLRSVRVTMGQAGKPVASGGKRRVRNPWRITDDALKPLAYRYSVPPPKTTKSKKR